MRCQRLGLAKDLLQSGAEEELAVKESAKQGVVSEMREEQEQDPGPEVDPEGSKTQKNPKVRERGILSSLVKLLRLRYDQPCTGKLTSFSSDSASYETWKTAS